MSRWRQSWRAVVIAVLAVAVVGPPQGASAASRDKVDVYDLATGAPVRAAWSVLDRSDGGITTKVRTGDRAGHAYTVWYAIFNAPEHCSDAACGEDDVFDFDPANPVFPFNRPQIEATRLSVVWANAGAVANAAGRLQLDGGLAVGVVPEGAGQVVIGRGEDDALIGLGVVTGLEDPHGAEIHLIIQDHGTAHDDPDRLTTQLTSFEGACNPACEDRQLAVHLP